MGAWRLPALFAVVVAVGLSGCGGDNDPAGEPPTTAPPDPADTRPSSPEESSFPAEFTKQVDPICVKAQQEIDKLAVGGISDQETLKEAADVYRDTATELEGLKPPEQNRAAYGEFTDTFRDGSDQLEDLEAEVARGDSSAYQRATTILDEIKTDTRDLASDYSFEECAAG